MCSLTTAFIFVGLAIGGPTNAWLAEKYVSRGPILIIFATITAMLFSALLIFHMPFAAVSLLCFLLGFFSSSYIQVFAVVRENCDPTLQGATLATANMLLMASSPIMQSLVGWVLSKDVPYHWALLMINILLYAAIFLAMPLHYRQKKEH
jgi:MFS family permease